MEHGEKAAVASGLIRRFPPLIVFCPSIMFFQITNCETYSIQRDIITGQCWRTSSRMSKLIEKMSECGVLHNHPDKMTSLGQNLSHKYNVVLWLNHKYQILELRQSQINSQCAFQNVFLCRGQIVPSKCAAFMPLNHSS